MLRGASPFELVRNYYEGMVFKGLRDFTDELGKELMADVACIALSQLPSWYIRHTVYAQHYLSEEQQPEMQKMAYRAIDYALANLNLPSR